MQPWQALWAAAGTILILVLATPIPHPPLVGMPPAALEPLVRPPLGRNIALHVCARGKLENACRKLHQDNFMIKKHHPTIAVCEVTNSALSDEKYKDWAQHQRDSMHFAARLLPRCPGHGLCHTSRMHNDQPTCTGVEVGWYGLSWRKESAPNLVVLSDPLDSPRCLSVSAMLVAR